MEHYGAIEEGTQNDRTTKGILSSDDSSSNRDRVESRTYIRKAALLSIALLSISILLGVVTPSKPVNVSDDVAPTALKYTSLSLNSVTSRNWELYKYTVPGTNGGDWLDVIKYYIGMDAAETDIGCSGTKLSVNVAEVQLHFVEAEKLEDDDELLKVSYWQNITSDILDDLSSFTPLMNSRIQILVEGAAFASIDTHVRSEESAAMFPGLKTMRRSSYYDDVKVVHLILGVGSNLYELVSYATSDLNLDGYTAWADSECALAQKLNFNPKQKVNFMDDNGLFKFSTGGGFTAGFWTAVKINTAYSVDELDSLTDFTKPFVGLHMDTYSDDFCEVVEVSYFDSSYAPALANERRVQYIRMKVGENNITAQWEHAVETSHYRLHHNVTQHWGSNWDHWLDRHIGIEYTGSNEEASQVFDKLYPYIRTEKNRPVGLRISIDDGKNSDTRFYTGYKGLLAWEYHFGITPLDWTQEICTCVHANNDLVYYEQKD